eukprot:28082_1
MSENVVLEEEYDPNYVPTNEEIEEYAEFLGMDLQNKEDKELRWIAEAGLKAPLPPEWKPCKTDDADIYYFNFETGESRWEHPCDEYYKKLYKTEKEKQNQKPLQVINEAVDPKSEPKSPQKDKSNQIKHEFDTLFQNEIETILESDVLSSEVSASSSPSKDSKQTEHSLSENWKKDQKDECVKQKQLYTQQIQKELEQFKEDLKQKQTSETESLRQQLQQTIKQNQIKLQDKYENELKSKEKEIRAKNEIKMETIKQNQEKRLNRIQQEHDIQVRQLKVENDEKLRVENRRREQEFEQYKTKHETEMKKKIDCLSENETKCFEEKYATEIEQRKQNIKALMHNAYEQWKCEKEEHYKQQKAKQIEAWELKHKQQIEELKENTKHECAALENQMRQEEQIKRDDLRNEYKMKYEDLIQQLKTQNQTTQQNIKLKARDHSILKEKYDALQVEHGELQNTICELKAELKQNQSLFTQEKRVLCVELEECKKQLLSQKEQYRLSEQQMQIYEEEKAQYEAKDVQNENTQTTEDDQKECNKEDVDDHDDYDDKSTLNDTVNTSESSVTMQRIDIDLDETDEIPMPIPSNVSQWSEYLQKEQLSIHSMRERINIEKKSMRQKQRKLEILKNEWKKERDRVQMSATANRQSTKNMLKKRKHDLDNKVIEMNERVLEIREASKLLNKRETRLQTLEIEYLRTQNNNIQTHFQNPNPNMMQNPNPNRIGTSNTNRIQNPNLNQNQRHYHDPRDQIETESMQWMPHPPNYPKHSREFEPKPQYTIQSNYDTNSMGQHHALTSVISKYVKHNQHTQRTINHHKSWLKAFQCELQSVSHSMDNSKSRNYRSKTSHKPPGHRQHSQENGEVVIRVKIDK